MMVLLPWVLLTFLSIPVSVFFIQVLMSLTKPAETASFMVAGRRPRTAVLVPAHDEAAGIAKTLANISQQLRPEDRVLVVADNCSDNTAQIARDAGAEVIERDDPDRRGKGYALDFGVRHLENKSPEVVVIVDADCLLQAGALDRLARKTSETGRPVQALYMMFKAETGRLNQFMAEFAWIIKNKVRPLGFRRLGLPCQLMGTGMSFPWTMIDKATLASDHIVEDLKLGIDLAKQGTPPLFCPEAEVVSYFPDSEEGAESQRTRWVHGHLGMIVSEAPGLLANGILRKKAGLIAMALDLSVPPLSLLTLWTAAMVAVGLLWSIFSGDLGVFIIASALFLMLNVAIALCWLKFGRHLFGIGHLPEGFNYVFGKMPLYYKFFVNRQVEWVRSKRDVE